MNRLIKLVLFFLSILLAFVGFRSLGWRFQHDSPIMLYIAFLIDRFGYVPYRDIFDMNMPGTYLVYYLIGRLFGYTDLGVRYADLLILTILLIANFVLMSKISWRVAWLGSLLWGFVYLGMGPSMSLQREYLILLPILSGVLVFTYLDEHKPSPIWKNSVVGFFFGIAAIMKPHAAIGLPFLLFFDFLNLRRNDTTVVSTFFKQTLFPILVGFSLPIMGTGLYLWSTRAISSFLDIATNYWPLYTNLAGNHETISGPRRIRYLLASYHALGGFGLWLMPASLGTYVSLYDSRLTDLQKRQVCLLVGLTCIYSIYPIFAGQFWSYHWLLFLYFAIQLSSLCLVERPEHIGRSRDLFPLVVLALAIFFITPMDARTRTLTPLTSRKVERVDEIAAFLREHLQPGDLVQPLDWTGGAVHAMLLSQARIASHFIYDFHFYHTISNDYIQKLRRDFITRLWESPPRFVVQIVTDKPWVSGADTTKEFEELQSLLDGNYKVAFRGNGYVIYEFKSPRSMDLRIRNPQS